MVQPHHGLHDVITSVLILKYSVTGLGKFIETFETYPSLIFQNSNMSFTSQNTNNTALNTSRPQHQLHDSSQPLPGSESRAAAQTQDYSPTNIERMPSSAIHDRTVSVSSNASSDDADSTRATRGTSSAVDTGAGVSAHHQLDSPQSASARGNTAFTSDRPLGVQPTSEGISPILTLRDKK
jgi:hypothetical protein